MKLYKHINNTDVAFKIININYIEDYVQMDVSWYNIVSEVFFIDKDSIRIKKSDLKNWIIINK